MHRTKSHLHDIGGDERFGHDSPTGKILDGVNTLDPAQLAAVPEINLMGSNSPDAAYQMEK